MARTATARAPKPVEEEIVFNEDVAIRTAVNAVSVALMMVDTDFNITYVNPATERLLSDYSDTFRKAYPNIDLSNMIGQSIDVFHKNVTHQRTMLQFPLKQPHRAEIVIGELRFSLHVTSVVDAHGVYVGNILEWNNVTEIRKQAGMLDALNRSQAIIEFSLDGTIISANENFLTTMGYRADEIVGRHHSMFVDDMTRGSIEYRLFWEKMGRGEVDVGQYKRIGKGGKEVWIQASYNPIFDNNGRPFKVVKYATDVTEQRLATANFEGQIAAINKALAVIEFDLEGRILNANQNFMSALGYNLDEIKGQHHSMFLDPSERNSMEYRMFWDKLGRGELDTGQYRRIGKGGKEIWIQASYNPILNLDGKPYKVVKYATDITEQRRIAERVKAISGIVASAATQMQATAATMSGAADEATRRASTVALAAEAASMNVQTVASAGEELSASISEIARQVTQSTVITQQAVAETDKTGVSIQTLAEAAQKIGNVVTLINNIAGQTKLLALNATIEAARAGDAGKGFAVVASEVKSLSDQTAKATHEISSQVSAMQAATETSVHAIRDIADTIRKVAEIASAIASAVEEQSAATREISANVAQAADGTQNVSSSIAGVSAVAAQTNEAAAELLGSSSEMAKQAEALSTEMDLLLRA